MAGSLPGSVPSRRAACTCSAAPSSWDTVAIWRRKRGPVLRAGPRVPPLAAAPKLLWAFSRSKAATRVGSTAPSARCCRESGINTAKVPRSTSRCFYTLPVCRTGRQRHRESGDLWRPCVDQGKPQNHGEAHCVPASAAPLDPEVHPQPRSYSRGNGKSQAEPLRGVNQAQTAPPTPLKPGVKMRPC